jgi:hypothetical protein
MPVPELEAQSDEWIAMNEQEVKWLELLERAQSAKSERIEKLTSDVQHLKEEQSLDPATSAARLEAVERELRRWRAMSPFDVLEELAAEKKRCDYEVELVAEEVERESEAHRLRTSHAVALEAAHRGKGILPPTAASKRQGAFATIGAFAGAALLAFGTGLGFGASDQWVYSVWSPLGGLLGGAGGYLLFHVLYVVDESLSVRTPSSRDAVRRMYFKDKGQ